jgi:hypothetical protein
MIRILDELVENVRDWYSADIDDLQVERRWIINPTPPCIDIYPGDPERDDLSRAFDDVAGAYLFTVRTRIHTAAYDETYDFLLETMDDEHDNCLPLACLDDPTLNGHAASMDVRNATGLRAYENLSGEGALLGWQFTLIVIPAKS